LGYLSAEQISDFSVRYVAHLIVVVDDLSPLVTDAALASLHQSITSLVLCAYVAVDAGPAFIALARVAVTNWSVMTAGK
jgi:uncharacterized membrane protein